MYHTGPNSKLAVLETKPGINLLAPNSTNKYYMLPGEVYITILDNSDISKVWVGERQVHKGETVVIEGEMIPKDNTEKLMTEIKDDVKKIIFDITEMKKVILGTNEKLFEMQYSLWERAGQAPVGEHG